MIPPEKKWMSLFSECRQSLGCHGDRDAEHWIVWKCVSLALTTGSGSKVSRNDFEITKELIAINGDMEQTAKVCNDLLTIQAYLSKVSEVAFTIKNSYIKNVSHYSMDSVLLRLLNFRKMRLSSLSCVVKIL